MIPLQEVGNSQWSRNQGRRRPFANYSVLTQRTRDPDDDWSGITDPMIRKRLQTRLNVRAYRTCTRVSAANLAFEFGLYHTRVRMIH